VASKQYDPSKIEESLYKEWEASGLFSQSEGEIPYCIMIPPPNVTGTLHMGHGFQNAIMDCLIRYKKMSGYKTHWQVGTDHAGIATEMVVERQLLEAGKTKKELGREKFEQEVWNWKNKSGNTITNQLRRLGASLDWESERFTYDEDYQDAVILAFNKLHEDGLIYRGSRLVNWDPALQTSLSDLEVVNKEKNVKLTSIKYKIDGTDQFITVATTRPETLLGDMAIAVHPDDKRYKEYIGKDVELPLCNRKIPIIADDYVDMDFGSGAVKITPGHDFNDYEIGKRHGLSMDSKNNIIQGDESSFEPISVLDKHAKICGCAPKNFHELNRFEARKKILANLESEDLIAGIEEYETSLPFGDRSDEILEPFLTDQWYVDTKKMALSAIDLVKNGDIKFVPSNWEKTYFQWLENIQDWCISRQLWWGHRIPVWYDESSNYYVGSSEEDIRERFKIKGKLSQDEDVLDTWFSSSLWTFATLGWPSKTQKLSSFHPTTTLVTGFDIIFFWVARMIMMTNYFLDEIPFKEVFITGLIKDENGQKMSKSKGNIIDPIDLIDGISLKELLIKRTTGLMQPQLKEKISKQTTKQFPNGIDGYGTDALRFTYYALASPGRDINFDIGRIKGYRNFCNKIWNAFNFIEFQIQKNNFVMTEDIESNIYSDWIARKTFETYQDLKKHINDYRFDLASNSLYELIWGNYCDWYIEFMKVFLDDQKNDASKVIHSMIKEFQKIITLLHPFMPFITEELNKKIKGLGLKTDNKFLAESLFDKSINAAVPESNNSVDKIIEIISTIRSLKSDNPSISNGPVKVEISGKYNAEFQKIISDHEAVICKTANLTSIKLSELEPSNSITVISDQIKIHILVEKLFNSEEEIKKMKKEASKLAEQIKRINQKLDNKKFVDNAPPEVIKKERHKLSEFTDKFESLQSTLSNPD
jgi:valyl-tRNA synthetase